jgi:hypothetical protein
METSSLQTHLYYLIKGRHSLSITDYILLIFKNVIIILYVKLFYYNIYDDISFHSFERIQHTNSKTTFHPNLYTSLPSPTKPSSSSPSSSPEPASPPSVLLNGKMEIGNQGSSLSTAAALSKITNFSIAAIINQQQNQHKLRTLDTTENEEDIRVKRRRLEEKRPTMGKCNFIEPS